QRRARRRLRRLVAHRLRGSLPPRRAGAQQAQALVQLRGRFTLWFAVAAVVTRYVLVRSYRREHDRNQAAAEESVRRALGQLEDDVARTIGPDALGSKDHELV